VTPRVVSEEEWNRGAPEYPPDACPECHRRPGFHGPDCPILKAATVNPPPGPGDALDTDPVGTVKKARGEYLRALGADPDDSTGAVTRLKEISRVISREAERRRTARDVADTDARLARIVERPRGGLYNLGKNIWFGLPWTGSPEMFYPELPREVELTRGEWYDWANYHRQAGMESMVDHLASIIKPNPGETYPQYRARLMARRRKWNEETDQKVVDRALGISRSPFARPRPAGPRSPARSRRGARPRARTRSARPARAGRRA